MVIPKYDIGQEVFIYKDGKMVKVTVRKIQILITSEEFSVGYQFNERERWERMLSDLYKSENEVFESLNEFIAINSSKE